MIYFTLLLCFTCITPMIETREIYIINSTPRVSRDDTVITCQDVDGDLTSNDLILWRVKWGMAWDIFRSSASDIDSSSIVATWDESSLPNRYGAFYCSGTDEKGNVTALKMSSNAEINPSADTMTVSIGDYVQILMTFNRDFGEAIWTKDDANLTQTNTFNYRTIYVIGSASKSDAGIYYAYFEQHPNLGGFTRLIVRDCPAGYWGPPGCSESCLDCLHNGVCDADTGRCICPPGFMGYRCQEACGSNVYGPECDHSCQADSCRSMQFCLPDPYGCSCATGWTGPTCEVECPWGLYGANCNETCRCRNGGSCERHVGCICPDEWIGEFCQRPKFYFQSNQTRVRLFDDPEIGLACGCDYEVEDCPLQDMHIEITNPSPMPPNTNLYVVGFYGSYKLWSVTPFGIAGNWDFTCFVDYRDNTYTYKETVIAIGGPFPTINWFDNVEANRDTTASMECSVAPMAGMEMDVKLRNEQGDLFSHSIHSPGSPFYLFHIDALDKNEGVFTCVATSQSGQTEKNAELNVLDQPVPGRAPSLISNRNGVVSLYLNTIPFVGDGPLTNMIVEYKQSTSPTWSNTGKLPPSTTTYRLENLKAETQYEVRVVLLRPGIRDEGRGEPGPVFTFRTLCSAPSSSVALQDLSTVGLDSTSLRIEWQNPVGQAFDRINIYYRSVDQYVFEDVEVNDVSATSYVLRGLQQYQTYVVQVKLMNCGYEGPASNTMQKRTKEGAPGPVRDFHVDTISHDSVSVTWQRPQNENGLIRYYNISAARSQPGTSLSDVKVEQVDPNESSYLMTNLQPATDYVISISAVTILSGPVESQSVTTKEWSPGPVRDFHIDTISHDSVSVTWQRPLIENGLIRYYNISAAKSQPGTSLSDVKVEQVDPNESSYKLTNLQPATDYVISIGAVTVLPGPVESQSVTTKEWYPSAAPTNIRGESSETTLTFTFDEITESERNGVIRMYETKLQDSTVTSSDVPPVTHNVTRERVMFDKLKDGTPYIFNVRGYTSVGPGVWSNDVIASTVPGPGPVRELDVHTISHDSVSVTWQRPQNDSGLIRYYNISAAKSQPGTSLADVKVERVDPNKSSYSVTNLQPATDYVISIGAVTMLTGPVESQSVTTKEWYPSAAPTNIRNESSETTLTFNFDEIAESERNGVIRMYETKLQDSTVTSSDVPPITKNVTREMVMFDKLKDGTEYIFIVRGYTSVGPGVWSNDVIASTKPGPGPVRDLQFSTISHDSVSIIWQPPQNEEAIIIYYNISTTRSQPGTSLSVVKVEQVDPNESSYSVTNLHPGTDYVISISAVTMVTGPVVSKSVTTKEWTPSAPPTNIRAKSTKTTLTFTFDEIAESERNGDIKTYETKLQNFPETNSDVLPLTQYVTRERVKFKDLTPATPYIIRVRGWTSVGPGVWSIGVVASTKPDQEVVKIMQTCRSSHCVKCYITDSRHSGESFYFTKIRFTSICEVCLCHNGVVELFIQKSDCNPIRYTT
ncbi:protein sidekick-1-like isoform X3 [Apostichopus japonicus]|uniref:protein sidekick-1-like isoform X3 n=1 Tax=Stichopus japonicus TaxID=307972 RepID=UPI003AB4573B